MLPSPICFITSPSPVIILCSSIWDSTNWSWTKFCPLDYYFKGWLRFFWYTSPFGNTVTIRPSLKVKVSFAPLVRSRVSSKNSYPFFVSNSISSSGIESAWTSVFLSEKIIGFSSWSGSLSVFTFSSLRFFEFLENCDSSWDYRTSVSGFDKRFGEERG